MKKERRKPTLVTRGNNRDIGFNSPDIAAEYFCTWQSKGSRSVAVKVYLSVHF